MKVKLLILTLILGALSASAQTDIESTAKRALVMGRTLVPEYVYMHFDNSAYYLGETIWFKAYVTSGNEDKNSTLSKVLYVELVAPEGYVVETKKYKLDEDGCCHGEFELNPLLLSGYYEIRAYTRYMLNRGDEAVYSRVFPIFDKVNANNWDFRNMLDRKRGFTYRGKWVSADLPECDLKFYPEGGHMVNGLTTRVAYELRAADGVFGNDTVTILKDGKPLLSTVPQHNGKGSFNITPDKKSKYTAQVYVTNKKGNKERFKFNLPDIEAEGVTINITQEGENIIVKIGNNFNDKFDLGFALLYRGTMGYYKKFSSSEKEQTYTIPKNDLLEGVTRAVIFNDSLPLAERQFFVMHDKLQKSDRQTVKLNVKGNNYRIHNLSPKPHEKITLNIEREDGKPISEDAQFSIAVTDAAGNQATSWDYNMYTYLLLGSELKGYIPNASQYFVPENGERHSQLDLIMLTHGWTSYDWSKLLKIKMAQLQPVERGITLKGTLYLVKKDLKSNTKENEIKPSGFNLTSLQFSYDNKTIEQRMFETDSTGTFVIDLNDFYGKRVGKLIPTDNYQHTDNVWYTFSLDRYYSPKFRLYDYWERNLGQSIVSPVADSLIKLNPFEYMLGPLEIVEAKREERNSRPPHSEMRFDYLDEWEYAQDITFLKEARDYDDLVDYAINDDFLSEIETMEMENPTSEGSTDETGGDTELSSEDHFKSTDLDIHNSVRPSGIYQLNNSKSEYGKYLGNIYYAGNKKFIAGGIQDKYMGTVAPSYTKTLTADDVVRSAMYRHNYNWAYWVQLMVVSGEYDSYSVPVPDTEYYKGKNPEKMVRFKEIVIRSDEKTRQQFENLSTTWDRKTSALNNKEPYTRFYLGFLSQSYLIAREGVDDAPLTSIFYERLKAGQISSNAGRSYPFNPNYVACLIPQKESDDSPIVPDFSNMSASRYTSVQGYTESKDFYSPDYGKMNPSNDNNDYRRTLLWNPTIKAENGKLTLELYNSSYCNTIQVSINGALGNTFFSNDENMYTRTAEKTEGAFGTTIDGVGGGKKKSPNNYTQQEAEALRQECELADILYNQQKYPAAVKIYAKLLEYNYPPAMFKIGMCYKNGNGLTKSIEKALEFFTLAADYGDATSMYMMADILYSGEEVAKNEKKALECFKRAEQSNEKSLLSLIAHNYRNGRIVAQDTAKAYSLFHQAAVNNDADGLYVYGRYMQQQGIEKDSELGTPLDCIIRATQQSHNDAIIYMMNHYYKEQKFKESYNLAKELHQKGIKEGTLHLADCYERGEGVKRDKRLAKDLREEAQRQ